MPAPLTRSRGSWLTALIVVAAFVICGIAWMRFFSVAAANPSPARYVEFRTPEGARDPFAQRCAGPAFAQSDVVWRFCSYQPESWPDESTAAPWGMVRFDLAAGEARLDWPLPEAAASQVLAAAESPQGEVTAAWGSPDLSQIYRLRPEGGVETLGIPEAAGVEVFGLHWAGDVLELVTGPDDAPQAFTTQGSAWSDPRPLPVPPECDAEHVCGLQLAHRAEEGWRTLWAQAPSAVDESGDAPIVFLVADEFGAVETVSSAALSELDPTQVTVQDGRVLRLGTLFDRSLGGAVTWSVNAPPYVLLGGAWERLSPPSPDASFYFSNYALSPDGLRWIPGLRYPLRGWLLDRWLTLRTSSEGVALAALASGNEGPTLAPAEAFQDRGGTQLVLVPSADGSYWLLGPSGAYLKATHSLARADPLSLPERVRRTFDNFTRLDDLGSRFFREQRALKMAALPLVLLSLPLGYLLVFFVRQRRHDPRGWRRLLLQVSAGYVLLATVFIWWFWEVMDTF